MSDAPSSASPPQVRIAVVTVAYNSAPLLSRTIESVLAQSHPQIQHVIVDGGSQDGTVELLQRYQDENEQFAQNTSWQSEPDGGIYDAMNKGWQRSSADVVGFLNADDALASPEALAHVAQAFSDDTVDATYADIELVDQADKVVRRWRSGEFHRAKYHLGWMTPHPTTYVRRRYFERYGGFRTDLPISADYELMLRLFYKQRLNVRYLPEMLIKMRAGGASNGSLIDIARANWQVWKSWRYNSLWTSPTVMATKPMSKLLQLRF